MLRSCAEGAAWEVAREKHLFPPEEPGNIPEAPDSAWYLAQREFNRALGQIRMPGEPTQPGDEEA